MAQRPLAQKVPHSFCSIKTKHGLQFVIYSAGGSLDYRRIPPKIYAEEHESPDVPFPNAEPVRRRTF